MDDKYLVNLDEKMKKIVNVPQVFYRHLGHVLSYISFYST
jgi:hypothetical protein